MRGRDGEVENGVHVVPGHQGGHGRQYGHVRPVLFPRLFRDGPRPVLVEVGDGGQPYGVKTP